MRENKFFLKLEENVIAAGIIIMVIMETVNVIARLIIPSSAGIAEEIAVFAYTFVCFLCASYCTKKGENIVVDVLTMKYNKKIQDKLKVIEYIVDTVISLLFLYGAVLVVKNVYISGEAGITGIPLWIIYTAPIFGFGLNTIRNIQHLVVESRKNKVNNLEQENRSSIAE